MSIAPIVHTVLLKTDPARAFGNETHWGKVLAWKPPSRLLLGWQINSQWGYDPELLTEVELTFVLAEGGGTLVTLEHRNLERFSVDAMIATWRALPRWDSGGPRAKP